MPESGLLAGARPRLDCKNLCLRHRPPCSEAIDMTDDSLAKRQHAKTGHCGVRRGGLTILEFLACTVAVIGGAWLGALVLGVDVRNLAFTALSESKLLDKVPAEFRPANPNEKIMTREQLLTTLHEELGSLRNQIATLREGKTAAGSAEGTAKGDQKASPELLPTKEKTLAYWERL